MFWVTDNFLMMKPKKAGAERKRAVRYQRINQNTNVTASRLEQDSDVFISGDEELLDSEPSTPSTFKNVEEILNVNRRNNSVV